MSLTIGEIVRNGRKQKGLSQRQLAKIMGVSSTAVVYWEKNINQPAADTLLRLATVLGIGAEFFPQGTIHPAAEQFASQVMSVLLTKMSDIEKRISKLESSKKNINQMVVDRFSSDVSSQKTNT